MSTWHKQVTQSLADSVSAILSDMKEDQKGTQNGMLKKGKGEPAGQIKPKQDIPEEDGDKGGKKLDPVNKNAAKKKFKDRKDQDLDNDGDTDSSDKFLHKKRKAITKAIRNTSESGKKVKLSGKKETVTIGGVKEETSVRDQRRLQVSTDNREGETPGTAEDQLEKSFKPVYNKVENGSYTLSEEYQALNEQILSIAESGYLDKDFLSIAEEENLDLDSLTEEEMEELLHRAYEGFLTRMGGKAARAIGNQVKSRVTKTGRTDRMNKKSDKLDKKKSEREGLANAKARMAAHKSEKREKTKQRIRNVGAAIRKVI